jgi:hypothetical protein
MSIFLLMFEAAVFLFREHVLDAVVECDRDAHVLDAINLRLEFLARHAIGRDAEMDHAAGDRTGLAYLDLVAESPQVVGGRLPLVVFGVSNCQPFSRARSPR